MVAVLFFFQFFYGQLIDTNEASTWCDTVQKMKQEEARQYKGRKVCRSKVRVYIAVWMWPILPSALCVRGVWTELSML